MSEKKLNKESIKLGLLGIDSVGKTSICKVLTGLEFDPYETTSIGYDKFVKIFKLENGKEVKGIIFDTAGQERFRSAVIQTVRNFPGIIIVFDVTNRISFDIIDTFMQFINDEFDQPSVVIFGNKVDIEKKEWRVTEEEIKSLAQKYNLKYFETSAKTNMNIKEGFDYIIYNCFTKAKEKKDTINLNNINADNQKCIGKGKNNNKKK